MSEVARHGARAPENIYNLTKNPEDNFKVPYALCPNGERQHFLIGAELRKRYIINEPLISSRYNSSEVFFRSSNTRRTIESLESQLLGLYPTEECFLKLNAYQQKKARPPFEFEGLDQMIEEEGENANPGCHTLPPIFSRNMFYDFKLAMFAAICPAYQIVRSDLIQSRRLMRLQEPSVTYLRPKFEVMLGKPMKNAEILDL